MPSNPPPRLFRILLWVLLLVALACGTSLVWLARRARSQVAAAESATAAARSARDRAVAAEWEARRFLYAGDMALAFAAQAAGNPDRVREILDRQVPEQGAKDPRGWEWRFLDGLVRTDRIRLLGRTPGDGQRILVSPTGTRVLASDNAGEWVEWDLPGMSEQRRGRVRGVGSSAMVWAPDGSWIALNDRLPGATNSIVLFLDATTWATNRSWAVPGLVGPRAVSLDGSTLWLTGRDTLVALSVPTGAVREYLLPAQSQPAALALSPDGQWLVVSYGPGALAWVPTEGPADFSVQRFEMTMRDDTLAPEVWSLAFTPDGRSLAGGCSDGRVRVWDAIGRDLVAGWEGHASPVSVVRFDPTGERILSAGRDSFGLVRAFPSGNEIARVRGIRSGVTDASWLGTNLVMSAGDRTVAIWTARPDRSVTQWTNLPPGSVGTVLTADGGHFVVTGSFGHQVCRIQGGETLYQLPTDPEALGSVFIHSQREKELMAGRYWEGGRIGIRPLVLEGRTQLVEEQGWLPVPRFSGESELVFDPAGLHLAVVDSANGVRVYGAESVEAELRVPGFAGRAAVFSRDGSMLAVAGESRVALFKVPGGTNGPLAERAVPQVQAIAFSANGDRLLTAGFDGTVRILDTRGLDSREPAVLARMPVGLLSVAMSEDGNRVVAGTSDGGVVFWDVTTGRELGTLRVGVAPVYSVRFAEDGSLQVAAGDGVRVYRYQ